MFWDSLARPGVASPRRGLFKRHSCREDGAASSAVAVEVSYFSSLHLAAPHLPSEGCLETVFQAGVTTRGSGAQRAQSPAPLFQLRNTAGIVVTYDQTKRTVTVTVGQDARSILLETAYRLTITG